MKKFFCSLKSGMGMLLVAAMSFVGIQTAVAADEPTITFNEPLKVTRDNNYTIYTIIPPETGTLYVDVDPVIWIGDGTFMYADSDCSVPMKALGSTNQPLSTFAYNVEENKPCYFSMRESTILGTSYTFTFSMTKGTPAPSVRFVYPEAETIYNLALAPDFQVVFNVEDVQIEGANLNYKSIEGEDATFSLDFRQLVEGDKSWRINMQSAFTQLKGKIAKDSKFEIVLVNPTSNGKHVEGQYVVGNNLVFPFTYMPQTMIVKETYPDVFLTYWAPGDPAGIIILEFDGDLSPLDKQPEHSFNYGIFEGHDLEGEQGMMPMKKPTVTIEGNKFIMDCTGVTRLTNEADVTVIIEGLVDAAGLEVNMYGNQALWKIIPYKYFGQITPVAEYTPAENSDISKVDEIELYIENASFDHFIITGFRFDCDGTDIIVPIEQCNTKPDPYDSDFTLIYIPVPELAKQIMNVTLHTITESFDGFDYDIPVSYYNPNGTTAVDSVELEAGSWTVYNLQGINVLNTTDYMEVSNLPKGIYIVNGKKVKI